MKKTTTLIAAPYHKNYIYQMAKSYLLALMLSAMTISIAGAGGLNSKMEKSVKKLVQIAQSKGFSDVSVAVFPFQTNKKLAQKRVNFAVSEILSQQIFRFSKFKLIERNQIDMVLKEQKLGLSGAIDTETAVKVGKLIGARLLILGSVSRLGKSYQISMRIVNTETAEIVAPEIFEVPIKVFDTDAKRYLTLVPDTQAIGLQLVLADIYSPKSSISQTFIGGGHTLTATPKIDEPGFNEGVGFKYFLKSWLIIEGTFFNPSEEEFRIDIMDNGGAEPSIPMIFSLSSQRLNITYANKLTKHFRLYTGLQYITAKMGIDNKDSGGTTSGNFDFYTEDENIRLSVPIARLGVEWRPQPRFGLSFFANAALSSAKKSFTIIVKDRSSPFSETEMELISLEFPSTYFEAAATLYF